MDTDRMTWTKRADDRWGAMLTPGAPGTCWLWRGRLDAKGYGFIKVAGRTTRAHRVAWARHHGAWPPAGQVVRHTCDTPACCNPDHLILGTVKDNVHDCIARGRRARGESLAQARLTEIDVRAIRRRAEAGATCRDLATEYGMTRQGIAAVVRRRTWRHVA